MSEPDRPPGELADFDALYQSELDYVWRTLGRLGVPTADLPDAAHDVFVIVYRKLAEIDQTRSIRPWLFGVARKIAAGRRRKTREGPEPEHEPNAPDERTAERLAGRDLLWKALATLGDDQREVIVMHDLEGHTGAAIGTYLGIPTNTVHSRLRLGRAALLLAIQRLKGLP